MTDDEKLMRFEELDAGRALGDLDAAEAAEWSALAAELGVSADPAFDHLASAFEDALGAERFAPPPADLQEKVRAAAPRPAPVVAPVLRSRVVLPWLGWAIAACLLLLLAIPERRPDPDEPSPAERAARLSQSPDALRLDFSGAGEPYQDAAGEVVWSDARQEGYMTLSNLPANDPTRSQYQLWIVDPSRDELPVDGGVFDIPAGGGPVVVPIDAKLAVENPAAFVITLERPGGVVRSKQEIVVALAKS